MSTPPSASSGRQLFDRTYASPFGIAPTGMAGAFRRDAELYLAQAAAEADIPYLMSGASNASMEQGREAGAEEPVVSDLWCAGPDVSARSGEAREGLRADHDRGDLRRAGVVEPGA